MSKEAPKGEETTAEERAKRICDDLEGRKMGKQQIAIWLCRLTQEIKAAEDAAYTEGYEACRKDLVTIQSAKWSKEAYAKGFADAVAVAALAANYFKTEDEGSDEVMAYAIKAEERIRALRPTGSDELK